MTKGQATNIVFEGIAKAKSYFEQQQKELESNSYFDFNAVLRHASNEIIKLIDGQIEPHKSISSDELPIIEQDTIDISVIDVRKIQ